MRKVTQGEPSARYQQDKEPSEYVSDNTGGIRARLDGDQIGLSAAQLIHHAREQMQEHDHLVDRLCQHLPRRFEDRVKALSKPRHRAERSLQAASILLENVERELRPGDPS